MAAGEVFQRPGSAAPPPLSSSPLARSNAPQAIREAVNDLTHEHHRLVLHRGNRLEGIVNGLPLGPLNIVHVAYGAAVTVNSPPSGGRVVVVIPLGPMVVESSGHQWVASTPFALSSSHHTAMVPDPVGGALIGATDADVVQEQVEAHLGQRLRSPISLSSERPLQLASPSLVVATWLEACRVLEDPPPPVNALVQPALLSSLLASMTLGLAPHLAGALSPLDAGTGPAYVRAARAIMEQQHAEPLTVEAVAASVGISARQLRTAFAEHLNSTPAQFLRDVRLEAARTFLTDPVAAERTTVAAAAMRSGFTHLGRFAAYYLEKYGELPSATLARARS